jgi:hypothetical protein
LSGAAQAASLFFNKVIMGMMLSKKRIRAFLKWSSLVFFIQLCIQGYINAEDNNQEIFNQLYQEIVNSSVNSNPLKNDSMSSGDNTSFKQEMGIAPEKGIDPTTEQLKKEIEKIIKDVQLRHSDAVKFMQDEK